MTSKNTIYRGYFYMTSTFTLGLAVAGAGATFALRSAPDQVMDRFRWILGTTLFTAGLVNVYYLFRVKQTSDVTYTTRRIPY